MFIRGPIVYTSRNTDLVIPRTSVIWELHSLVGTPIAGWFIDCLYWKIRKKTMDDVGGTPNFGKLLPLPMFLLLQPLTPTGGMH